MFIYAFILCALHTSLILYSARSCIPYVTNCDNIARSASDPFAFLWTVALVRLQLICTYMIATFLCVRHACVRHLCTRFKVGIQNVTALMKANWLYAELSISIFYSPSSGVIKDLRPSRHQILKCINFGICESSPKYFCTC